ncbi:DUF1627 domain-containing protein [Escherichia coli]|uniref:DUF1627 domain-containing protein n=8 Tax=root TaxID=1 RepID=A0A0A8KD67_ECOLX|nr:MULTISPECIES: DUF1627 domain-containing protein [Escherichia]YP_006906822.1 DUF1627 domain-containing protein [Escherichia phage P13374]YP_007001424.1 DUF1627 domain-containing protein [Escherichia phage TL-2011c]AMD43094.1 PF07789 domain protein [Escherichia phage phiON-2011]EEZ8895637.1 DUF1627 domain-containing protein [Escherichia coli O104]EGR60037.1 hypothetical protein HUSEC41_27630 [Escherichia coli O104:H4 str. 01-09591]EGR70904.1 hypothetical protein HUSEC_28479 [Escherichia coli
MNAVLTELNKLGKASAESISKGLNIDLNDVIDTLWKLKNQGVVTVKNGIWQAVAREVDKKPNIAPVQPVQHNIIGDLLRKSRKEARRAGRKQKRWEGACKALQELNKYRDLINELSE